MLFPHPARTVPSPAPGSPGRRLRRLAGPAAGLLVLSLATGLTTGSAYAVTSGTISVTPSSGTVVPLETTRLSSQTVIDLTVPASSPFYAAIQLRSASSGAGYRAKVGIAASGSVTASLSRVSGGAETALGTSQAAGTSVKAGDKVRLQGAVAGLNPVLIYVRAWKVGAATPDWQLAARDYTAARITTGGESRLWGYLSGSAPSAATVAFSNVTTIAVTTDSVANYPVKTWANVGTPTPTPTP
ncbi:MAG: hypothetical protein ACOH1Y_11875, partial [Propionicimonas sp.]